MADENKPTLEELKAKEEEAAALTEEDLKKLQEEEEEDSEEEKKSEGDSEEGKDEEEADEGDGGEVEQEEEEAGETQADPSKELYKKKFSASSRENQRINAKNRVINKALVEADELPEPTEEDLEKEYKDWDVMTETEKMLAKETLISKNWRGKISQAKDQVTKIEKWNDSVEEFVGDPKTLIDNPSLEGKTEEFKEFAEAEENNNVPFKLLVSAFLHDHATGVSSKKVSNKGKMFERGSGGPNDKPKPKDGKISLEEARKLRESNYPLWKEKNAAGLIDFNI